MVVDRFAGSVGATATLLWSACAARRLEVSARETSVFRWFNGGPEALCGPAWAVMQGGSLGAVFAAAGVTRHRGRTSDALRVLAVGSGVWAGVKAVKPLVGRGRPARCLDDVTVRGQPQSGLGYPSGHAAVSMALALTATGPGAARRVALVCAGLVGASRMYVGAHLPLDVGGGLAFGFLLAAAANRLARQPNFPGWWC